MTLVAVMAHGSTERCGARYRAKARVSRVVAVAALITLTPEPRIVECRGTCGRGPSIACGQLPRERRPLLQRCVRAIAVPTAVRRRRDRLG